MVCLDVSDCRFYGSPAAEQGVLLPALAVGVGFTRCSGNQYRDSPCLLDAPIATVASDLSWQFARIELHLFQGGLDRLAVVFLAEGYRSDNQPALRPSYRNLVAELVFLVFLALADAFNFRLVDGVDLLFRVPFLSKYAVEDGKKFFISRYPAC